MNIALYSALLRTEEALIFVLYCSFHVNKLTDSLKIVSVHYSHNYDFQPYKYKCIPSI